MGCSSSSSLDPDGVPAIPPPHRYSRTILWDSLRRILSSPMADPVYSLYYHDQDLKASFVWREFADLAKELDRFVVAAYYRVDGSGTYTVVSFIRRHALNTLLELFTTRFDCSTQRFTCINDFDNITLYWSNLTAEELGKHIIVPLMSRRVYFTFNSMTSEVSQDLVKSVCQAVPGLAAILVKPLMYKFVAIPTAPPPAYDEHEK